MGGRQIPVIFRFGTERLKQCRIYSENGFGADMGAKVRESEDKKRGLFHTGANLFFHITYYFSNLP